MNVHFQVTVRHGEYPAHFEGEFDAQVSRYVPAQISGPVEACYPAEGGEVEGGTLTVLCGPSTGAELNPVACQFHDIAAVWGEFEFSEMEAGAQRRAEEERWA